MKFPVNKWTLSRVTATILALLIFALAVQDSWMISRTIHKASELFSIALLVIITVVIMAGALLCFVLLVFIWDLEYKENLIKTAVRFRDCLGWYRWPLLVITALAPALIILYSSLGFRLTGIYFRFLFFSVATGFVALFLNSEKVNPLHAGSLYKSILIVGSIFALAKAFTGVVDYPLSLTWSEGNRIWDYSILFGRDLYNFPADQPLKAYIDRGRQTLWGLPFLLPNVSILGVRLWSAIIMTIPYFLLGWMAFRPDRNYWNQWIWLGVWTFLFLNQGPIYAPLILSAILVAGSRRKPFLLALLLVGLAGYYAQKCRFTWMMAPALWGGFIALTDKQSSKDQPEDKQYWLKVVSFTVIGILGGIGFGQKWTKIKGYLAEVVNFFLGLNAVESQQSYFTDYGDPSEIVSSMSGSTSFKMQTLLWERLLPNPTYGPGIILGLLLAVVPVLFLLVVLVRSRRWHLNFAQQLGLFVVLVSFLFLGLIISSKIGGGGDLHNLDMFFTSIIITAGIAWENGGYTLLYDLKHQSTSTRLALLFVVVIPAFMPWINATPLELPPEDKTSWTLELLKRETARVLDEGEEILFMDQRQLLTFGNLGDIPLVAEFEKKLVMDRAMAGNTAYLVDFYEDISRQRFGLIISDPQRIRYADEGESWEAENDTWVERITKPLLCYYEPVFTIKATGVWFLEPRDNPGDCNIP